MLKLIIDGKEIEAEEGLTVFQACQLAGSEIPHFCFHERLNVAGNCRMCLVEIDKSPKPVASCAMPISEGMIIHTFTPKVQKAREGVMEFLLINHPLDCPICDQGGECDLQDQAFKYGRGTNRFEENKRSVKDKNMGPLIKTHMTRCIHCTRCIRFATEVAGIEEIGAIHRGEHMEVTSYLEKTLTSELSGNMIDICPVGALTSKPYAFKARNWELEQTESIDVLDAVGSNIVIGSRGLEVMRILPKINDDINEEWISDKARFSYDGLKNMRIDRPYVKKDDRLVAVTWQEALEAVAKKFKAIEANQIAAIAGSFACVESMFILKKMLDYLGCKNMDANQFNYKIDSANRGNYLFNTTIAGIEQADLCLLIGANPRKVAPIINARIGKMQRQSGLIVARVGKADDQTYKIKELGDHIETLQKILDGTHDFTTQIEQAKNPIIIIGDGVYSRSDGYALLALIHEIADKYKIELNILHNHASMVGSLDIGFTPKGEAEDIEDILTHIEDGKIKLVYLLGADEIDMKRLQNSFVIYQGHHGDAGASIADIVLPSSAYTEKSAIYVNLEGRPQITRAAVKAPNQAKEDWIIIRDIADQLKIPLAIPTLSALRSEITQSSQIFQNIEKIIPSKVVKFCSDQTLSDKIIDNIPTNYYMTDTISRASVTMSKCLQALQPQEQDI